MCKEAVSAATTAAVAGDKLTPAWPQRPVPPTKQKPTNAHLVTHLTTTRPAQPCSSKTALCGAQLQPCSCCQCLYRLHHHQHHRHSPCPPPSFPPRLLQLLRLLAAACQQQLEAQEAPGLHPPTGAAAASFPALHPELPAVQRPCTSHVLPQHAAQG